MVVVKKIKQQLCASLCTDDPLNSLRKNREKRRLWIAILNCVPVHISTNYFLLLFHLTVEKMLTDQHDSGLFKSMYAVILSDVLNLFSQARF